MRQRLLTLCLASVMTISALPAPPRAVRACGLDGIPSMVVDGQLVVLNHARPAPGRLAAWAPFVAPRAYAAGRPIVLREIRGRVLWTLPPSAFKTPWRWTFGDGAQARGLSATHTYRRPGDYVAGVRAYLVDGKDSGWFLFDTITIHVHA